MSGRKRNYSAISRTAYTSGGKYAKKTRRSRGSSRRYRRGYDRSVGYYGRFDRGRGGRGFGLEYKFWDVFGTGSITNVTADNTVIATDSLNLIPQGTSQSQMIGRKVTIKTLEILLETTYPGGIDNTPTGYNMNNVVGWRVMVVLDKQCNGTAATVQNVVSAPLGAPGNFRAMPNLENTQRFDILKDQYFTTRSDTIPYMNSSDQLFFSYGKSKKITKLFLRINKEFEYSPTAVGDPRPLSAVRSNNLFLIIGVDTAGFYPSSTGTLPSWAFVSRIRFSDA